VATEALGRVARTDCCDESTARDTRVAVTEAQPERAQLAVTESTARQRASDSEKSTVERARERGPSNESPSDQKAK